MPTNKTRDKTTKPSHVNYEPKHQISLKKTKQTLTKPLKRPTDNSNKLKTNKNTINNKIK